MNVSVREELKSLLVGGMSGQPGSPSNVNEKNSFEVLTYIVSLEQQAVRQAVLRPPRPPSIFKDMCCGCGAVPVNRTGQCPQEQRRV